MCVRFVLRPARLVRRGRSFGHAANRSAVILDRHPLWLDAMSAVLEGVGVEVVGRAVESGEAVRLVGGRLPIDWSPVSRCPTMSGWGVLVGPWRPVAG